MPLDIHLSPLYRIGGQEESNMPGVLALNPPKNAARGRETDRLIVYLLLAGNSTFTTTEYKKLAEDAAQIYYQTPRATTSALKASADFVNKTLLEKNMTTSASGKYALGYLLLASFRESQCIFSISGPMQAYIFNQNETKHIFEPSVSGKGLGSSQNTHIHFAQTDLNVGDLMLLCGKVPNAWLTALKDTKLSSLDSMRRKLTTITHDDLNTVLIQSAVGSGVFRFGNSLKEETPPFDTASPLRTPPLDSSPSLPAEPQVDSSSAHVLQPSAYAIPMQEKVEIPKPREFPASIPRAKPKENVEETESNIPVVNEAQEKVAEEVEKEIITPREPSERTRQTAKAIVTSMQSARKLSETFGERFRNFLPRLLPDPNVDENSTVSSNTLMLFLAIVIPLIVVTLASVVYLRYGRSEQYDTYLNQARQWQAQAVALTNPIEKRKSWENVLINVSRAEEHRVTTETINLRNEANSNLDTLLGLTRMQFNPAFSAKPGINISRMAASENALYLLNAENGEALRATPALGGGGFQLDSTFNCKPGNYGNYRVGPLVDILALPTIGGLIDASLLGIDASGNLLYCKSNKVAEAIPLPTPDTNWGRVTGFVYENGNLYVLDSTSRAVWVYIGKDGTFTDRPYFFFGQQTPTQDTIDFIVSGDEMYLLHADGRLSSCSFSRIDASKSNCKDPLPMVNPFPAYQDIDLFGVAHFTQLIFAAPPDPSILVLDADGQSLMRFAPRSIELQNQFRPTVGRGNPIPTGSVSAVAVSPDHVLYYAVDGQVYFAVNMP
ncbi:MAG: hypothetical protein KF758_03740 [Anaerolineales bacterium]|nr:hypothetical protein [Anaerolineales bacterium]